MGGRADDAEKRECRSGCRWSRSHRDHDRHLLVDSASKLPSAHPAVVGQIRGVMEMTFTHSST